MKDEKSKPQSTLPENEISLGLYKYIRTAIEAATSPKPANKTLKTQLTNIKRTETRAKIKDNRSRFLYHLTRLNIVMIIDHFPQLCYILLILPQIIIIRSINTFAILF